MIYGFNTATLNRQIDRLNGHFIEVLDAQRGAPRDICLLPRWENPEAIEDDPDTILRRLYAKGMGFNEGNNPHAIYPGGD